jgi:DNA-binding MarR family transcriptional regulator
MGERAGLAMRPYPYGILARIRDRQPVRTSDVAEVMDYDRSTISRHIAELTNLGCVARESDPADGRVVIVRLTEEGTRVIERVYDAWYSARDDIYRQWQEQTDPLNVQPDIPRLFREVAQHLRDNWPDDKTEDRLRETVESVEAPVGQRYERELRKIFEDESLGPVEKSRELVDKIEELGLQPFEAPDPYPPIEKDEVKLVCWMMVVASDRGSESGEKQTGLLSQVTLGSGTK